MTAPETTKAQQNVGGLTPPFAHLAWTADKAAHVSPTLTPAHLLRKGPPKRNPNSPHDVMGRTSPDDVTFSRTLLAAILDLGAGPG